MKRLTHGFGGFVTFALSQLVSLTGSGMSQFALGIWLWNETGSATAYALVAFLAWVPRLVFAPLAGALADRMPRKTIIFVADFVQGLGTVALLLLYLAGSLAVWHIYVLVLLLGIFGAFQAPAASSVVSTMVPKERYTQANGLRALVDFGAGLLSPILAGVVLGFSGGDLKLVFIIDLITMTAALSLLALIRIPSPKRTETTGISDDMKFGFRFLAQHRGLLYLAVGIALLTLFVQAGFTVLGPLILARTGGDELAYGFVMSAIGLGGIIGATFVSTFGDRFSGTRPMGVVLLIASLLIASIGLANSTITWAITAGSVFVVLPLMNALYSSLLQRKVPSQMQGRVFGAQGMILNIGTVTSMLAAGPLADFVFEPAMHGGVLEGIFAPIVGVGTGSGISVMLLVGGVIAAVGTLIIFSLPQVRNVDADIPDADNVVLT